jgi:hypothetical protein
MQITLIIVSIHCTIDLPTESDSKTHSSDVEYKHTSTEYHLEHMSITDLYRISWILAFHCVCAVLETRVEITERVQGTPEPRPTSTCFANN